MRLLGVLVFAGLVTQPLSGQTAESRIFDLQVRAAVWGQVNRPGQFYLEGSPDLFELLSAAGGPTQAADLNRLVLIRERDGTRQRVSLNRIASSGQPLFIVSGDVVIVPESFWSRFQRSLPAISTVATVVNVAITLVLLSQQ